MKVYAAFLVILILSTVIVGQFAAPKDESFSKVDGVVVPWRDSGCNRFAIKFREPGCVLVNGDARQNSDRLELYDSNATLWFSFSANAGAHLTELKTDFVPFAVPYFNVVALRMVAESPHWYEVEVNEKMRETRFALKGEPYWGKTTFAHWIYESRIEC